MSNRRYTNEKDIPLALAVFLATDNYDYDPGTVSATRLMKPARQVILASRVPDEKNLIDIDQLIQSRLGTAIHDGIEAAWKEPGNFQRAMSLLGYGKSVFNKIVINPEPEKLNPNQIPVYLEQRHYRTITVGGKEFKVSGKMDFVAGGAVQDYKSTIAYTYKHSTKTDDFCKQGSIYRWLAPHIITADYIHIHYIFMDWAKYKVGTEKNYPPKRMHSVKVPLMSLEETDAYIRQQLSNVMAQEKLPEKEITFCTKEQLWQDDPVYKYYKNPKNAGVKGKRSTKNFDNPVDAQTQLEKDKSVGTVLAVPGQIKACLYCAGFPVCTQKDQYIKDGLLTIE